MENVLMEHWKLECQNYTLGEVASLLRNEVQPFELTTAKSKIRLAEWLEELDRSRQAIYDARIAFAKVDKEYGI